MSSRERLWLTVVFVASIALIAFFLTDSDESAVAQAPSPTAISEPHPDIVRHYRVMNVVKPKASKPRAISVSGRVAATMRCIARHETPGSTHPYTQQNLSGSSASGKYQYIDSTWRSYSKEAGYPGWKRAMHAPPAVQEAVTVWVLTHHGKYPWGPDHC